MKKNFTLKLSPEEAYDPELFKQVLLKKAGILFDTPEAYVRQTRRSIDDRGKQVKVNIEAELFIKESPYPLLESKKEYFDVSNSDSIVIVGAGPAGLFAALRCIELGYRPVVIERGKDVRARRRDIAKINR